MPLSSVKKQFLALSVCATIISCTGPDTTENGHKIDSFQPPEALTELPKVDLSRVENSVRDQLTKLVAQVEEARNAAPDERAKAYADLGLVYLVYDYLEAAEAALTNARALDSSDFRWTYLVAYLRGIQGRLPEAAALYEATLELDERYLPALVRLGRARLDLAEPEVAESHFERALELDPNTAAAHEGLGKASAAAGDPATALEHFKRALALAPEANSLHYVVAQAYREMGRLEEARFHLEQSGDLAVRVVDPLVNPLAGLAESLRFYLIQGAEAMDDSRYAGAEGAFIAAVERDPTSFEAYRGLALARQRQGDQDGAVQALRDGIEKVQSADPDDERRQKAGLLRSLATLATLGGRPNEALQLYRDSLELLPEQPDVLLLAGNAEARGGFFEKAIERYDQLIALEPEWRPALLEKRATALVNLQRGDEAVADFENAVAAAPENRALRLRFAAALDFLGNKERAASERAAAQNLPASEADQAAESIEKARQAMRAGDVSAAVTHFEKALEILPSDVETRFALGSVLAASGQFAAAVEPLRKVLEDSPRHTGARSSLVGALLMDGQWGAARGVLQETLQAFPRHAGFALMQVLVLATAPDENVRNGGLALEIALRLQAENDDVAVRQALALAYAANDDFAEAVALQLEVLEADRAAGAEPWVRLGEARLAAFENGEAWTARSPQEILLAVQGN